MNEKYEKYLPLGSVVLLREAKKRLMIVGFAVKPKESDGKIWDYVGCLYPEGLVTSDKNILFDHKDIHKIYGLGYADDEHARYINFVKETLKRYSDK